MNMVIHNTEGNEFKVIFSFRFVEYFYKARFTVVFLQHGFPFDAAGRDVVG